MTDFLRPEVLKNKLNVIEVMSGDNWIVVMKKVLSLLEKSKEEHAVVTLVLDGKECQVDEAVIKKLMSALLSNKNVGAHEQREPLPGDDIFDVSESVRAEDVISVSIGDFGFESLKIILDALKKKPCVDVHVKSDVFHVNEFTFMDAVESSVL